MITKENEPITRLRDGSYRIRRKETGKIDQWMGFEGDDPQNIIDIEIYIKEHPESLIVETVPKSVRIAEIKAECNLLDLKVIRPLLAGETEIVDDIKAKLLVLRNEYKMLQKSKI